MRRSRCFGMRLITTHVLSPTYTYLHRAIRPALSPRLATMFSRSLLAGVDFSDCGAVPCILGLDQEAEGVNPMEPAVREISCKSALTKSGITDYAINPYIGCAHNCVYCYASFMARFSRHDRPWGQWVDVKVNAPDALAADLRRAAKKPQALTKTATDVGPGNPASDTITDNNIDNNTRRSAPRRTRPDNASFEIVMSSVTDPYQPLERKYRITRACLEVLASELPDSHAGLFPTLDDRILPHLSLSVLTKSDLVVRDIDVLQNIPSVEVGLSITSTDDSVSRLYERGASPATRRLAALNALSEAGIRTWAFVSPVLPHHSDSEPAMLGILRAIQDTGASRVMVDRFNPYPASVSRFSKTAPPEAAGALREYTRSQAEYLDRLRDTVWSCASRLGMAVRVLF